MTLPEMLEGALRGVVDQKSFIHKLLKDCLQWPNLDDAKSVEKIAYEWTSVELNADGLEQKVVDGKAFQIQPLTTDQPFGIFLIEFKNKDAFTTGRGMVGPLRKVLRGVVKKKTSNPDKPSWKREHLLFICTHEFKRYRIAYFKAPPEGSKAAPIVSFSWGDGVPARTACEFNLPALQWPQTKEKAKTWVADWAKAFDVEKVTRDFFEHYHDVFQHFEEKLKGKFSPKREAEQKRLFTQGLFNRLMFLRFIERKGWLELNGDQDYLKALFAAGPDAGKSFYQSRLKPLFFDALAVQGQQVSPKLGKVPFLNGGLFEPNEHDDLVDDIPDEAFTRLLGSDGLFYRFNFTVEESTPLDIEVAVDPEMLGKVFEELVTGRHESGSYYTPRNVVSFMCREALKGYLSDKTGIEADRIADLVDNRNAAALSAGQDDAIRAALASMRAVDPACGSGAYLLGLLQETLGLYDLMRNQNIQQDAEFRFKHKLKTITHNLYGVDLDPFATNIAMLRLWLSLAVEATAPQPLPNLLYNIETGDALLAPDPSKATHEFDAKTKDAFAEGPKKVALGRAALKAAFVDCHDRRQKAKYAKNIAAATEKLREMLGSSGDGGSVDWRIEFAEVFAENGGFDIVLANPPYVRQELIKEVKPSLKKRYGNDFNGTADLYVYFYYRALELLRTGGMLVFISSNKWFRADYGEKLRNKIAAQTAISSITDFGDLPVFESAIAYPMIFVTRKKEFSLTLRAQSPHFTQPLDLNAPYPDVLAVISKQGAALPNGAITKDRWLLTDKNTIKRMLQMKDRGEPLAMYVGAEINRGVLTGFNDAFIIDGAKRADLIRKDRKSAELIKPLLTGRDIKRWRVNRTDTWLIFTRRIDIDQYPAIKAHLTTFKTGLVPKPPNWNGSWPGSTPKPPDWDGKWPGRKEGDYKWYEIQDNVAYDAAFAKPKIIYPVIIDAPQFAFDEAGCFCNDKGFIIPVADKYLCGVLNSSIMWMYLSQLCSPLEGGFFEMRKTYLENVPIPRASSADQKKIGDLVQQCLTAKDRDVGADCSQWEREISRQVAALYGFNPDEVLADLGLPPNCGPRLC